MEKVSPFTIPTKQKISTTLSAGSLDIGQLIAANVIQNSSLLSESVTYDSALSSFSETPPTFPVRDLPGIATVALGEHLKMFPGTTTITASRIMLASPTSPRLRSLCKECLSISKWAEYSMGWDAPGHVPWENTLEQTTRKWLPEGSLFSSESFSRALFHARNLHTGIDSDSSRPDDIKLVDLNSEMLEMMRELHNLRSYFAETLHEDSDLDFDLDSSHKPPVPALVVSTSYMTFPLTPLESFQNVSQDSTPAIATRRGRKPLPPLTIQKKDIPSTPHPGISTNSPGISVPDTCDIHPAVTTAVENSQKSALRVEEMISNLRLQCSSMLPTPSPPVDDTSWNSRSPMPLVLDTGTEEPNYSSATNKHSPAQLPVGPGRFKTPTSMPTPAIGHFESRLKGKLNQPKFVYKKRTSTDLSSSQLAFPRKSNKPSVISTPTRVVAQKIPRSAMAKDSNRSQKPYKLVRFALPKSEVARDLGGFTHRPSLLPQPITTDNKSDPDSKIILLPGNTTKTVPLCPSIRMNSIPVRKDYGGIPISTKPSPLRSLKMRTRSMSIAPFRKNALTRESVELKSPTTQSGNTTQGRRSHSLGAHPFSRIIKGPILALKENKRATISIDSTAFKANYTDKKKRMSIDTVEGNHKKNRMPIHIKSLLTRFK